MLNIVENQKEFTAIPLGQILKIYTYNINMTFKRFHTSRVLRCRLILEEYSPDIEYIKGGENIVADTTSRLP